MNDRTLEIAGVNIKPLPNEKCQQVINEGSVNFLLALQNKFNDKRLELVKKRDTRYASPAEINFLEDDYSRTAKAAEWQVPTIPSDLLCRHAEITGPTDAKIVTNALTCNASCFMADFEDATSPTWKNIITGQLNLLEAIRGQLNFTSESGKNYCIDEATATAKNRTTLLCRPRGWHLNEKNITANGQEFSGSLVDFGLYAYLNAKELAKKGSGAYYYLPKLEHYEEAILWSDVIAFTENTLGLEAGSIKVTVLIETLPAVFQLEEILYALKNNIVGLNCGRWDYIFSAIKCLHSLPNHIYPNRDLIDMSVPFMNAYSKLVVKTCHRHGAYAMGGMSANIPIKSDHVANENMMQLIKTRKMNEIANGHDGTWVAHPALVPLVLDVYKKNLGRLNQLSHTTPNFEATKQHLIEKPAGSITEEGLLTNITAALIYMNGWLSGNGCLAVNHLMEDAATAEISRAQIWQWVHYKAKLDTGEECTLQHVSSLIDKVCAKQKQETSTPQHWNEAATFLKQFTSSSKLAAFMTTAMYKSLS